MASCREWKLYSDYQICVCGSKYRQWRVFIFCPYVHCDRYGKMISLHRINTKNIFSDFFKENRGTPIAN